MHRTTQTAGRREAFTLVEMLVVIAIILVIAALAAAFAPNVSDSQNLTRSIDQLEQWLLTAKMRAKRDQLATGLRFVPAQGDTLTAVSPGTCSQFQYIQQPDALAGGWVSATQTPGSVLYSSGPPALFLTGSILQSAGGGSVTFANADFTMGGTLTPNQFLVQAGDFLEVRDNGVYQIAGVTSVGAIKLDGSPTASGATVSTTTIQLINTTAGSFDASLGIVSPTTNYRILRQPRILIGESPLQMPNNFAVDTTLGGNVQLSPAGTFDIVFSPSGAVVGANAGNGKVLMIVHDIFGNPTTNFDPNRAGIVGVQARTGFIGAYSVAPLPDRFSYVENGRESGL